MSKTSEGRRVCAESRAAGVGAAGVAGAVSAVEAAGELAADAGAVGEQRRLVYALLARLLRREVDEATLAALKGSDVFVCDDEAFGRSLGLIKGYLASPEASVIDLARDYARTFCGAGSTKKSSAYPFESVYTSRDGLLMQDARDGALAWYRRFGLTKNESWLDCEDHVALELEFMEYLIGMEAEARADGRADEADDLLRSQRDFAREHLANWLPRFARDADAKARTDFYRGLVRFASLYVKRDLAGLEDVLTEVTESAGAPAGAGTTAGAETTVGGEGGARKAS